MTRLLLSAFICLCSLYVQASDTARVLFIGNSYIGVNNLPDLTAQIAANRGDVLLKTDASVGGATLQNHWNNAGTRNLIAQGTWDYVILQEQSQLPAFPDAQVASNTYPYARLLDSLVSAKNPCAKTVFYMTWGRKNGDASNCPSFPLICTYQGMDSLLRTRYSIMAQANQAILSPVGLAWNKMRSQFPAVELYSPDESHPSEAGSYLAATTFYTILFRKSPASVTFDYSLSPTDAANIRQVVKEQVWDSLGKWYRFNHTTVKPTPSYRTVLNGMTATFNNTSSGATSYRWLFGDGQSDTAVSPTHTYSTNGLYHVQLIASNCGDSFDTLDSQLLIGTTGIHQNAASKLLSVYPLPANNTLHIACATQPSRILVYDTYGRQLFTVERPASKQIALDVASMPTGHYTLKLEFAEGPGITKAFSIVR